MKKRIDSIISRKKTKKELVIDDIRIVDIDRIDIRGELSCGTNVVIDINVIFEGKVELGNNVIIEPNCIIKDSIIGNSAHIKAFSLVEGSKIGNNTFIGPYARIRRDNHIANYVQIGNFVEIKKSTINDFVRINHLSFIGDADIKKNVTIGAGTITCNHNGVSTNTTIINEGAYVGSGSNLVAPILIGKNSTIGAGSTIVEDTPSDSLTVARKKQKTIKNWSNPSKNMRKKSD